ncbi:MAG TPA: hypothetical protein PK745_12685, partial [bacterium]|nr:hypothetical protein [bacterium]
PGESAKSAFSTAVAAVRLDPGYASFNVFVSRPGSKLRESGGVAKETSSTAGFVARLAYALFYMRPSKVLFLMKKTKWETSLASFAEAVRYILFMPEARRDRANRKAALP